MRREEVLKRAATNDDEKTKRTSFLRLGESQVATLRGLCVHINMTTSVTHHAYDPERVSGARRREGASGSER